MNVSTLPAGAGEPPGIACAGQLTKIFAQAVEALGGNRYVTFALNMAQGDGGLQAGAAGSVPPE
jgi:hypothetical protein